MDPRTQALINFSKGTGRGRPVVFGGRKDEIEDVAEGYPEPPEKGRCPFLWRLGKPSRSRGGDVT